MVARLHPIPNTDDLELRLLKRLMSALLQHQLNADPISPPCIGQSIDSNMSLMSRTSNLSLFSVSSMNSAKYLSVDISAKLLMLAVDLQDHSLEELENKTKIRHGDKYCGVNKVTIDMDHGKVNHGNHQRRSLDANGGSVERTAKSRSPEGSKTSISFDDGKIQRVGRSPNEGRNSRDFLSSE